MSAREKRKPENEFDPIAGLLALVLPGLGHAFQRRLSRALPIAAGVLGLFLGGLLIGGLSVVDLKSPRTETRISFIAQAFVGPIAFAVDRIHQARFKTWVRPSAGGPPVLAPPDQNKLQVSLGKVNEIGVLYTVLAGMLNFIAFLDALMPPARRHQLPTPKTTGTLDAVIAKGSA